MSTIETPSGTLYYTQHLVEDSPYPPLILVHGAGGDHLAWPAELRRLPFANVYCLDLPNHGRSGGEAQNTILGYAEAVQQFWAAMNLSPAIVVGHSMGGAITQTLALAMQTMVAGIVLIGTGPRLAVNSNILDAALNDLDGLAKMITRWQWGPSASEDLKQLGADQLRNGDGAVIYADYVACNGFDARAELGQIAVPTLIVAGTADKMTPIPLSEELAASIPLSTMVTIEDGGHMMMLEQPQKVAEAVIAWLKEHF